MRSRGRLLWGLRRAGNPADADSSHNLDRRPDRQASSPWSFSHCCLLFLRSTWGGIDAHSLDDRVRPGSRGRDSRRLDHPGPGPAAADPGAGRRDPYTPADHLDAAGPNPSHPVGGQGRGGPSCRRLLSDGVFRRRLTRPPPASERAPGLAARNRPPSADQFPARHHEPAPPSRRNRTEPAWPPPSCSPATATPSSPRTIRAWASPRAGTPTMSPIQWPCRSSA